MTMPDLLEAPECFTPMAPSSDAELARTWERITKLKADRDNLDAYEKARIAQIQESCQEERDRIEREIALWESSATAYLQQIGDRVRLPDLGVSLGAREEKGLRWTDEAALKTWAINNGFLNTPKPPDPGPDKKRIQEHFTTSGEIPPGAEVKTGYVLSASKIGGK